MEIATMCVMLVTCFLLVGHGVEASHHNFDTLQSLPAVQPYRTAYHFQPPKNWMNDPNGPMYYKGVYHLFYQYNPYGALWGNIVWAHSVSYDLVNWVHLNPAIYPTGPFDIKACFSGSATILPSEKPAILYTGIDIEDNQAQNLAMPKNLSDPLLREWIKSPLNPLMTPVDGIDPKNFRDPATAWQAPDGSWRVVVGGQINGHATAILYRSNDFVNWTKSLSPLHSSNKTGMWECPDFFPVGINSTSGVSTPAQDADTYKHVLKVSFNGHDSYILGNYVPGTDRFEVETDFLDAGPDLRYDYGKFYASKSFFDPVKKRRVLWGWVGETDGESASKNKGWSGLQSFPRSILLGKSGRQLVQWPIKEIEKLRSELVIVKSKELERGSLYDISGITASQADVEVSFEFPNLEEAELMDSSWVDAQLLCTQKNSSVKGVAGPFGLLVLASKNLTEQTAVFFRIFKNHEKYTVLMCSDHSRSSLNEEVEKPIYGAFVEIEPSREKISLRTLIDHSIVESFGGEGKACITGRVYPKLAIDGEAHLYAFNSGTLSVRISSLSAWSMKQTQTGPL